MKEENFNEINNQNINMTMNNNQEIEMPTPIENGMPVENSNPMYQNNAIEPLPSQPTESMQPSMNNTMYQNNVLEPLPSQPTESMQPSMNNTMYQNSVAEPLPNEPLNSIDNQQVNVNQIQGDNTKPKNKKIIIVSVILGIVVIALAIVGFILFKNYNNPRNRLVTSMIKSFEKNNIIENNTKIYSIFSKGINMNLNGSLNLKVNNEEYINGKIDFSIIDSPSDKQQYYNVKLSNDNEQIIDLEALSKDNRLYFSLKEIFDKFYYLEDMKYVELFNENIEILENNIKNSISTYFKEDKFTKSNETITINGVEQKLTKINVSLSDKDMNKLITLILENILKEENALKIFETEDYTYEDIKTDLQTNIDSLKETVEEESTETIISYNVYVKGYEVKLQEIDIEGVIIKIEGSESGKFTISEDGTDYITGTFNKSNLKLTLNIDGDNVNVDITHETKVNNQLDGNYNITLDGEIEGTKLEATSIINLKVDNNNTIPTINTNTSKAFEDMTEEEMNNILSKLKEVPTIKSLIDYYESLYSYNNYYDEDYSYDYSTEEYSYDYSTENYSNEYSNYNTESYSF